MKDLKKIHIVFRNCDYIEILREDIYNFYADGITESISLYANACQINKVADEIHLTLDWDKTKDLKNETFNLELRLNLEHKHITSYYLYFDDDSEIKIIVPWDYEESEDDDEWAHYKKDNELEIHEKWSDNKERELMSITHKRIK